MGQCYVCGEPISIGTTCDSCRERQMNRPKLIPQSYKIEQNINEHTYFVEFEWNTKKWAVSLISGATKGYLSGKGKIVGYYPDVVFDTPEEALTAWEKWYTKKDKPKISEWSEGLLYELNHTSTSNDD